MIVRQNLKIDKDLSIRFKKYTPKVFLHTETKQTHIFNAPNNEWNL